MIKLTSIGGGSGLNGVLVGEKNYAIQHPDQLKQENIFAIVSVFDSGGHTGKLKKARDLEDKLSEERKPKGIKGDYLPPGDLRNCSVALANDEEWARILNYRTEEGDNKGKVSGNDLLDTLFEFYDYDFEKAIHKMGELLKMKGQVIPCTTKIKGVLFGGRLENGEEYYDEEELIRKAKEYNQAISEVFLKPNDVEANPKAVDAIMNADKIILSQGSIYTSLIPNLLVKGISEAIRKSKGAKIYIMNIATQRGETDNFTAKDHIKVIEKYLGTNLDKIIINNTPIPYQAQENYKKKGQKIVEFDLEKNDRFVLTDLLLIPDKIDEDTILRHDPYKIADAIMNKA